MESKGRGAREGGMTRLRSQGKRKKKPPLVSPESPLAY